MQIFTGKHSIKSESVILRGLVASLLLACSISLFRHGMGQEANDTETSSNCVSKHKGRKSNKCREAMSFWTVEGQSQVSRK